MCNWLWCQNRLPMGDWPVTGQSPATLLSALHWRNSYYHPLGVSLARRNGLFPAQSEGKPNLISIPQREFIFVKVFRKFRCTTPHRLYRRVRHQCWVRYWVTVTRCDAVIFKVSLFGPTGHMNQQCLGPCLLWMFNNCYGNIRLGRVVKNRVAQWSNIITRSYYSDMNNQDSVRQCPISKSHNIKDSVPH